MVDGWAEVIHEDEEWLDFWAARGVPAETLRKYRIGLESVTTEGLGSRYSIPVFGATAHLVDCKLYTPGADERKNIHWFGLGKGVRLWNAHNLAKADPGSTVLVTGGEPDALRLCAAEFLAVSGTSGEGALPRPEDLNLLRGMDVVTCLDQDKAGRAGAKKWVKALLPIAASVRDLEWPIEQGKDVTDWLLAGHTAKELQGLIDDAPQKAKTQRPIQDLLDLAIKRLEMGDDGGRNDVGLWLACQLRDERYSRRQAGVVLVEQYVPAVTRPDDEYTEEEALASVESAYSQPARKPSGISGDKTATDDDVYRHMTDTGNAERFAMLFGELTRYCPALKGWFIWNGRIWARDDGLQIMTMAKKTVRQMLTEAATIADDDDRKARFKHCFASESVAKLRAMTEAAQSDLVVRPQELDANPYLLCVENGTLDLRTGELREHDPADLITLMAPVEYKPNATEPRWEELLDKFVRPDDGKEAFLQRAAFASLTGTTSDKVFINLYDENDGNTGKTTFSESLLVALGPYGGIVNAEAFLTRPNGAPAIRSDLAALAGKRMVVSSETPPGRKLDTALMKKLTQGGGKYVFERKYENPWEGDITFTIWLDGNSVAKANAEDNPLFDRWRLTPFKHKIAKASVDKRWMEKAAASPQYRSAVLAWAMKGRVAWLKEGIGSAPSVDAATAEVRAEMDPLRRFWDERCHFAPHTAADPHFATRAMIWQCYSEWVAGQPNTRAINEDSFMALLKAHDVKYALTRFGGKPTWGWQGIRLEAPVNIRVSAR
jgi:putative DNA primase/helicase